MIFFLLSSRGKVRRPLGQGQNQFPDALRINLLSFATQRGLTARPEGFVELVTEDTPMQSFILPLFYAQFQKTNDSVSKITVLPIREFQISKC